MISKRTKIVLGLVSICIGSFFATTALAYIEYNHEHTIYGYNVWYDINNNPVYEFQFSLTAKLDVTSNGFRITSYSGSTTFISFHIWIFPIYEIVSVSKTYELGYTGDYLTSVKYTCTGYVRKILNHAVHVWVKVWVIIYGDGGTGQGISYWDKQGIDAIFDYIPYY
ncbi:MAG: hypothetical protein ACFE9Z_07295 [Promethearchaeota archaeon]